MEISERSFEFSIEQCLLAGGPDAAPDAAQALRESARPAQFVPGGYRRRRPLDYDRRRCLLPDDVLGFVYATQPKQWEKFKKQHGDDARDRLLGRLADEIRRRGALDVLRRGVKSDGSRFQLAHFQPSSGRNPETQRLYEANLFSVVRQLRYSERNENSLDLVLFLNGLPIFTAELKNPLTGQDVQNAIRQYRFDREPAEPLFAFGRCLAHFAVDPDLVYMTTRLQGPDTHFLPFNQGRAGGAGNPPAWRGFATAYLWQEVWARDSVLDLIQHFIQVVELEDDQGRKTGDKALIFPRYHQLDAVRRLVRAALDDGPGRRYLIQHSAGSGKSNSIAWLAHRLAVLHDAQDRRVFDSIVVITDRRVLDRQLQRTVRQFEQTLGVVENIDATSRQLKEALEGGKTIIVTTLQKFPVIAGEIGELPGKRFAVVIDEAHSSQTGESTKSLKSVLAARSLEEAEQEEGVEGDDLEDRLIAEMKKRGQLPNVSYFAFTATPKPQTLELFGAPQPDGRFAAFSLYSMRQAIEEGFILDVLENYTTYRAYWNLLKTVADDPRYDRKQAIYLLRSFVELHEHAIAQKVAIMVEHFAAQVQARIGGKAKAMIVTRSRLHAVRYRLALDRYLKEHRHPFRALVAFSGTVRDGGLDYTEAGMNGFPESQTAERFKNDENRLLVVAYKFQTGFDQPLLHTMYVDKKLNGVHAVQTLSRLNRIHPGKEETLVLDFVNAADDIQQSFQPYYDRTLLAEGTDPNLLHNLEGRLADLRVYTSEELIRFAAVYFDPRATQDRLLAALRPAEDRFKELADDEKAEFRGRLQEYVRLYAFLSQIITFVDPDLERLYLFGRLLLRRLPVSRERLPLEIQQKIDMETYRLQKTGSGRIGLARGQGELEPTRLKPEYAPLPEEIEPLSHILQALNERFGTSFSDQDRVFIEQLEAKLAGDPALDASVRVNTPGNARLTFDHVVNDVVQDLIDTNFKFYKQITDDADFGQVFFDWLFDRYLRQRRGGPGEAAAPVGGGGGG